MRKLKRFTAKYSTKKNRAVVAFNYALGATSIVWNTFFSGFDSLILKIILGSLFIIFLLISIYFLIRREEFGLEGIVHVHKDNNYSEIAERIKKAEHKIEIIAYYGINLLEFTKNVLIEALKRDVDINLLIAKENSELLKEVWELEDSSKETEQTKAMTVIKEIQSKANNKSCSFKYYQYNTQARYAIVIIDGKWAWWTPYHPGLNVPETSSFVLVSAGRKSIIQECKKHFRTLWVKLEKENNKVFA